MPSLVDIVLSAVEDPTSSEEPRSNVADASPTRAWRSARNAPAGRSEHEVAASAQVAFVSLVCDS